MANPNKTQDIINILAGNKDKLLRYLKDFHNDTSAFDSRLCLFLSAGDHRYCKGGGAVVIGYRQCSQLGILHASDTLRPCT